VAVKDSGNPLWIVVTPFTLHPLISLPAIPVAAPV
jgi:hypothetical protein